LAAAPGACHRDGAAGQGAMDDEVSREDIARIEAHIEALTAAIERCRKLSLTAKIAIGAGVAWIALTLLLVIPYVPYMTIGALAAVIGGVVLLGSNATTWTQTESTLRASEAMRADMIGRLELRVVGEESRTVH
jgi:hypothetical protein